MTRLLRAIAHRKCHRATRVTKPDRYDIELKRINLLQKMKEFRYGPNDELPWHCIEELEQQLDYNTQNQGH